MTSLITILAGGATIAGGLTALIDLGKAGWSVQAWARRRWSDPAAAVRFRRYRARFAPLRDRINQQLGGRAHLWSLAKRMPTPQLRQIVGGELAWLGATDVLKGADGQRRVVAVNGSHGLALDQHYRHGADAPLGFVQTDYATIVAARALGHRPPIISSGAIVFCPADRTLLLLHRSANVATFPGGLHILGGNYEPRIGSHEYDDGYPDPLRRTAMRELEEESRLSGIDPARALVLVSEETETGFVQFVYAGISIPKNRKAEVTGSLEAATCFLTLDEFVSEFQNASHRVVPSGALLVAAWLGLGAPDQSLKTPMKTAALKAYEKLMPCFAAGLAP